MHLENGEDTLKDAHIKYKSSQIINHFNIYQHNLLSQEDRPDGRNFSPDSITTSNTNQDIPTKLQMDSLDKSTTFNLPLNLQMKYTQQNQQTTFPKN